MPPHTRADHGIWMLTDAHFRGNLELPCGCLVDTVDILYDYGAEIEVRCSSAVCNPAEHPGDVERRHLHDELVRWRHWGHEVQGMLDAYQRLLFAQGKGDQARALQRLADRMPQVVTGTHQVDEK